MKLIKRPTRLVDAQQQQIDELRATPSWDVGKVTSTDPLNIRVAGEDLGALGTAASYTPAANDMVIVLFSVQRAVVVDKIA